MDISLELDLILSSGHYEWHVAFPQPDIDLGAVRARIDGGILVIDVPRRRRHSIYSTCRT